MKNFFYLILSPFIYALQFTWTAIIVLILLIVTFFQWHSAFWFFVKLWGHVLFLLMGVRLRVAGLENYDRHKKFLVLTNHASLYDVPAIMAFLPNITMVGRDYLAKIPLFGQLIKMNHFIGVPKNKTTGMRKIINEAISKSSEITITMFPEGTRSLDGNFQEFKRGFVHIVKSTDLDILPVTMTKLFHIKPKTRFAIHGFKTVDVIVHPPILNSEAKLLTDSQLISTVKSTIQSAYK